MNLRSLLKREKEPSKQNKVLKKLRNKVFIQAAIAVQTLVIAIALIFGLSRAWYSNVLQTSGLQFQAEAWGFSGSVTVQNVPIQAAPGDSGVIGITIDNSNGEMLDAAVKVTKTGMDTAMQQRLFFYVEDRVVRNGETMDRVYVNAVNAYTYTVLDDSMLHLTDQRANDAPLQWQWVYDMLGYYFLGTVNDSGTLVEEYLRPVEYDLDSATFDENGNLLTVDGVTFAESFLNQLAATDGYDGNTMTAWGNGYYQVAVDAQTGHGVWVYLCNWEDIEQATIYDTDLGLAAGNGNVGSYPATITLIGQPAEITYTQVSTVEALETAIANGEMVQLSADLVLTEVLHIQTQTESILDLNGHTITGPTTDVALRLTEGSQLLLTNGTVAGSNEKLDIISIQNSDLTLNHVTVTGQGDDAIDVVDRDGEGNSTVRLFHCTVNAASCAVYMCGDGSAADGVTKVVVEECDLRSDYVTIMSNGNATNWGTELQITRSVLQGYYAALYQPQSESITTVTESKLSGITGVVIKAGNLMVENSEFYGTGTGDQLQEPGYAASGFKDTGDALFIEDSYGHPIVVRISGSHTKMVSESALAVRVFAENSAYVDIAITDGYYSTDVTAFLADGYTYDAASQKVKEGS